MQYGKAQNRYFRHWVDSRYITGYEYQVWESFKAIDNGQIECAQMPHNETVRIMQLMDDLRREWGVHYPCDRW